MHYSHCSKLFKNLRKESEFWQRCCRNSTKLWERKRKNGREKILNFGNGITEIPAAQIYWPINQLWQCHCRNREKKNLWQLWQCHCWKWEEKKNSGCRNLERNSKNKCYVHNIFTTNHMWLVIISSNLNLTLRLLF